MATTMPSIMAGLPNHLIMRIIREHTTQKNLDYHISRMKNAPAFDWEWMWILNLPLIKILWSDPELKKEIPDFWMLVPICLGSRLRKKTRVSGETLRDYAFGD